MGHYYPSFLAPLYSSQFFCPFLFSFHSLPSKMDKRQEECPDTPHRRLFIFRHCWISRSKPGETARALCDLSFCFSMLSFSLVPHVSQSSLSYLPPPAVTRPPVRFAHCKTAFFPFRMVFTEDLGNCSLTVRTTSASNAGPPDGFVRWAFNETPDDPMNFPSILFLPIPRSPPPFNARFWCPVAHASCSYASWPYAYTCTQSYQWQITCVIVYGITYDFAWHFVFHPSRSIGIFRPTVAFFPSRAIFPVHFPVYRVRCFW